MTDQKIILVDGSSYLFRAYHALPPLTNSQGQPTGAIYGVVNMLRRLLKEEQSSHIAVIFDAKGKNFRHEMYPEYKAHRPPMPDDLATQIEPLHSIIEAMGFPILKIEGVEADDVIGTLAHEATAKGFEVLISTSDKDLAQLVDPHISLVNTMTEERLDERGVLNKFSVKPEQIIDYLSLIGDTSDNVPGIPKVGPKTAVKWLDQYGSVSEIIKHADEIKGKVGENLRSNLEQLELSQRLVTIKLDIDLPFSTELLELGHEDTEKLKEWYEKLEFKTWLQLLEKKGKNPTIEPKKQKKIETILSWPQFEEWLKKLTEAKAIAFDTETDSLNYMQANIVGISFAVSSDEAAYIPFTHNYDGAPKQLSKEKVLSKLSPLLSMPDRTIIGHHIKYDAHILRKEGIEIGAQLEDTMLMSYVLNATAIRHDLNSVSKRYLNHAPIPFEQVAGKGVKQITFDKVDLEAASTYAAEDAWVTFALFEALRPQLTGSQLKIYEELEIPLVPVLLDIEHYGVCIDKAALEKQSLEISEKCDALEKEAFKIAGETFNLSSPKQLQTVLYENLGLPVLQKTPTGQPSTAEPVLQELSHTYPLPAIILNYRSLSKLKSTYTDKLPQQIDPITNRVHTSYHQATVATGRLSSSDPNLQNIPVRTEEGRHIREAFIAPKGYKIVAADYSQIELRIMAHLSGDPGLIDAFSKGEDIHRYTASEVFSLPIESVTPEQRRRAKAINFGLIYGMSAFGLAKQLEVSRSEASEYIAHYFERYPGVKKYMDSVREQAADSGYVETLFGRRLYLADIRSRNMAQRKAAERAAINAPMQGTAADLIKKAMITLHQELLSEDCRLIMQVHDELVFEIAEDKTLETMAKIEKIMCSVGAGILSVPLEVGIDAGPHWDAAH